jgi:hypothetical protein
VPFTLAALTLAVAVSHARGGRFRFLAERPLAASWLLFTGVVIQVGVDVAAARGLLPDAGWSGWVLLLLSQVLVVAFLVANRELPGVWLVATGLLLNVVVIAANRAMPVDPAAIAALGLEGVEVPPGKHTLLTAETRLPWLADIIAVPWLRSIISLGDIVLAAGLLPLTHGLLRPAEEGDPERRVTRSVVLRPLRSSRGRRPRSERRAGPRRLLVRRSPRLGGAGRPRGGGPR